MMVARSNLLWLTVLLVTPISLIRLRFWADMLLFLSIATVSLSVYQIPLPGGQTLQLLRAVLLMAIIMRALTDISRGATKRVRLPGTAVALAVVLTYNVVSFLAWSEWDSESLSILVAIGFGLIYALWLPQVIRDRSHLRLVMLGIICANSLVVLYAVYQYAAWFTGFRMQGYTLTVPFKAILLGSSAIPSTIRLSRIGSLFRLILPFGSSSHLGSYIASLMLATLPLLTCRSVSRHIRRWLILYHAVMFILLLGTFSRGAWLGWIVGLLVILAYQKNGKMIRRIVSFVLVVAAISTILVVVRPELPKALMSRLNTRETESSDQTHLDFAWLAIDIFAENPLRGAGPGSFYRLTGIAHPHNTYLHICAELGLLGATLWFVWIALVLWDGHHAVIRSKLYSLEHQVALGLLAAFTAILVNNVFQQSLYFSFAFLVPGLIGAVFFIVNSRRLHNTTVHTQ